MEGLDSHSVLTSTLRPTVPDTLCGVFELSDPRLWREVCSMIVFAQDAEQSSHLDEGLAAALLDAEGGRVVAGALAPAACRTTTLR